MMVDVLFSPKRRQISLMNRIFALRAARLETPIILSQKCCFAFIVHSLIMFTVLESLSWRRSWSLKDGNALGNVRNFLTNVQLKIIFSSTRVLQNWHFSNTLKVAIFVISAMKILRISPPKVLNVLSVPRTTVFHAYPVYPLRSR